MEINKRHLSCSKFNTLSVFTGILVAGEIMPFMKPCFEQEKVNNSNEKVKLRMRLRGAQAKLDNFRVRYKEAVDEMDLMNRKYEEASAKLKERLASYGIEVLNLKKQLAALQGQ